MIAVLGAGPHGRQLAHFFGGSAVMFDDYLPAFRACSDVGTMPYVLGAAWPATKRQIVDRVPFTASAWEKGIIVMPGVRLGHDAQIGHHVHLLFNSVISHGCKVGAFSTICSGAVLCGEVTVEDDVFIGANATVIHGGIKIGRGAIVGAGAVVINDVPAGATVVGNPAQARVPAWTNR